MSAFYGTFYLIAPSTVIVLWAMGKRAVAREAEELAGLESALRRLSEGEYGVCTECGEPIARERLFANPAATRCAECQQFAERAARHARATRS
jgi:RNA polymerase-binding transcription factor DksA